MATHELPPNPARESGDATAPGFEIVDFAAIDAVPCPCGESKRALASVADFPGTLHRVEISEDAQLHYHTRLTETYYFLSCEDGARMQLDDRFVPVHEGMCIVIRPGTRHRAVGRMTVLNIVVPEFDPDDEWFD